MTGDNWAWVRLVAGAGYESGAVALAVQLAVGADRGLCCRLGARELARRARQNRDDVARRIQTLIRDGFLDAGARGGGRGGAKTALTLADPALLRRSEVPELASESGPVPSQLAAESVPDHEVLATESGPVQQKLAPVRWPVLAELATESGPVPSVLNTARPEGEGGEGEGDPLPPRTAIVEDLIARLPVQLHPYAGGGEQGMRDVLGRLLAQGWTVAEIVAVAHEPLPPGPIKYPWALLERRFRDRVVPTRSTAPAHVRWRAQLDDAAEALDPAAVRERAREARGGIRAGAS